MEQRSETDLSPSDHVRPDTSSQRGHLRESSVGGKLRCPALLGQGSLLLRNPPHVPDPSRCPGQRPPRRSPLLRAAAVGGSSVSLALDVVWFGFGLDRTDTETLKRNRFSRISVFIASSLPSPRWTKAVVELGYSREREARSGAVVPLALAASFFQRVTTASAEPPAEEPGSSPNAAGNPSGSGSLWTISIGPPPRQRVSAWSGREPPAQLQRRGSGGEAGGWAGSWGGHKGLVARPSPHLLPGPLKNVVPLHLLSTTTRPRRRPPARPDPHQDGRPHPSATTWCRRAGRTTPRCAPPSPRTSTPLPVRPPSWTARRRTSRRRRRRTSWTLGTRRASSRWTRPPTCSGTRPWAWKRRNSGETLPGALARGRTEGQRAPLPSG
nr:PREDICTED: uncharacterized protein LOC103281858 [Anolis carolinensis]|eukprot:XP_008122358.1 PREDICTED: uncharacterized protein LOC103281858 [Anolis carolinensis]